jgi:hypothetical protein
MTNRQQRDRVVETASGFDCIVAGRQFGTWATRAMARAGMAVEQRRAAAAKPYFTLLERDHPGDRWAIAFGDYQRSVVAQEMDDLRYAAFPTGRRTKNGREWKIIRTSDGQKEIEAEVARINGAC